MTAAPDDNWLDERLRRVDVPEGLIVRLQQVAVPADEQLDRWMCSVEVPQRLLDRLRAIPTNRVKTRAWSQLAAAAAWLLFFGVTYVGAMATIVLAIFATTPVWVEPPVRLVAWAADSETETLTVDAPVIELPPADLLGLEMESPLARGEIGEPVLDTAVEPTESSGPVPLAGWSRLSHARLLAPLPDPAWLDVRNLAKDREVLAELSRQDRIPDFWSLPPNRPRGVKPPLARGFDSLFLLAEQTHPIVALRNADPELRRWLVPLAGESTSFDLARRYLERGQRPPAEAMRVEDFWAAFDPELPTLGSGQDVGLTLRGGVTPFGARHPQMPAPHVVQIGVRAREVPAQLRPACRLTVLVDCSSSMEREQRLVRVRRALDGLIGQLGPADLLSLVAFDDEPRIVFEDGTRAYAAGLRKRVATLRVEDRSTNLAAGLEMAYMIAASKPSQDPRRHRVVILTDGGGLPGSASLPRLTQAVAQAHQRDQVELSVVHLGTPPRSTSGWHRIVEAGGGRIHSAITSDEVRWGLAELLTGHSQRVAAAARLLIEFDPATVLAYRMIGHEATDVALQGGPVEVDLYGGQTSTSLFEVYLAPGASGPVASASLAWRDPLSGATRQQSATLARDAVPDQWEQSPDAVRRAVVAAQIGEILRNSFFARGRTLADVLNAAGELETIGEDRTGFTRVLDLARDAAHARNERVPSR